MGAAVQGAKVGERVFPSLRGRSMRYKSEKRRDEDLGKIISVKEVMKTVLGDVVFRVMTNEEIFNEHRLISVDGKGGRFYMVYVWPELYNHEEQNARIRDACDDMTEVVLSEEEKKIISEYLENIVR